MKVKLKNCFLEEEHEHAIPYLETYQWEDGSTSELPACCINSDLGISEFPSTIKRLIRVDTTNTESQMVSGIYSSELMEVDNDLFFISTGDIDEAQTDCYFIRGTIKQALEEYLIYNEQLDVPFMQIFKALQTEFLDKVVLNENWIPISIFNINTNWDGLNLSIALQESNLSLKELISEVALDESKVDLWKNKISKLSIVKEYL
jgi:hypothetical protein